MFRGGSSEESEAYILLYIQFVQSRSSSRNYFGCLRHKLTQALFGFPDQRFQPRKLAELKYI